MTESITINRACPKNCKGNVVPQWLDKPDNEGWWWYRWGETDNSVSCRRLFISGASYIYYQDGREWVVDETMHGKWCKAIVPTLPQSKE